jgi:hydrogenase 3 maturation protease
MRAADAPAPLPRLAVIGIGHELRGDDAAGLAVARALHSALGNDERLIVIDAGPAPENYTGPVRGFAPDVVLFVDAAQMGEPPGTIRWVSWQDLDGFGGSTHTLSLHILATFLIAELGCKVCLIGIQPAHNPVTTGLSPEVTDAVDSLVLALVRVLAQDWRLCFQAKGAAWAWAQSERQRKI